MTKVRLEILPAVIDAFDQNGVSRHHEGDGRPSFETNRSQARQQVVAGRSAKRERVQALAERDDATDIAVSRVFARSLRNVLVKAVQLTLGKRREEDAHRRYFALARRPLMRPRTSSAGAAFDGSARYSA